MRTALGLAARGLGRVWPNPAVGCVLVNEGPGGWPRLDPAWRTATRRDRGPATGRRRGACAATAYVMLEPCSHRGETPPCADALIAAGIVARGHRDRRPGPARQPVRVPRLCARPGIAVIGRHPGQMKPAPSTLATSNATDKGLPLVTLKTATTLDGKIATHTGQSRWITGERVAGYGTPLARSARCGGGWCRHGGRRQPRSDVPAAGARGVRHPFASSSTRACACHLTHRLIATARKSPNLDRCDVLQGGPRSAPRTRTRPGSKLSPFVRAATPSSPWRMSLRRSPKRGITRLLVEGGKPPCGGAFTREPGRSLGVVPRAAHHGRRRHPCGRSHRCRSRRVRAALCPRQRPQNR